MKPTSDERREVAENLRKLAEDYEKVPAWNVIAAGELPAPIDDALMTCGVGRAFYATELCGRLADLIEPEERTCRIRLTDTIDTLGQRMYQCSSCGYLTEVDVCFSDDGVEIECFSFYPNCGAKVVSI